MTHCSRSKTMIDEGRKKMKMDKKNDEGIQKKIVKTTGIENMTTCENDERRTTDPNDDKSKQATIGREW